MAKKLPGKKYEAIAGSINDEVRNMDKLKSGDDKIKPVPIVRTKSGKRVSMYVRKQN